MKKHFAHLDVLRLISVLLVMYGHFVIVGGDAFQIPLVVAEHVKLPLFHGGDWQFWRLEVFLVETFKTQSAILGVSIFFLITGYLMPLMLERYSRMEFLLNRFFRIFPVLCVAVILLGVFLHAAQGIRFSVLSYISSISLTYLFVGVVPVMGVLWTLVVEVFFYLLACVVGKFTIYRLYALQTGLLMLIWFSYKYPAINSLMLAAVQAKYMLMICIGSAVYLVERETAWDRKIGLVGGALIISFLGFQLFNFGHVDGSNYATVGNHLLAFGLFVSFHLMGGMRSMRNFSPKILKISELVYPIYLVHAAIGLICMLFLRQFTSSPYILLLAAIFSSLFMAWILHVAVEVPGIALGRKIINKMRQRNTLSGAKATFV